jgi:hypothetical protein
MAGERFDQIARIARQNPDIHADACGSQAFGAGARNFRVWINQGNDHPTDSCVDEKVGARRRTALV